LSRVQPIQKSWSSYAARWLPDHRPALLSRYFFRRRRRFLNRLVDRADRARDGGDYAAAAELYRRALALDPRRPAIRVQLAHMLKELTRFGEAEAAYRQALAQSPDDGDLHLQLGHLLKLLGRTEDAVAAYFAARELLPDSDAPTVELRALGALPADPVPGVDADASGEHIRNGDRPCVDADAREEHIRNGDRLRDADRYAEAAQAYGRALALSPERSDIRIQYGNMLKDAGRLAQAEAAYRQALAQSPDDGDLHLQLGHLLKLLGRTEDAIAAYCSARQLLPDSEAPTAELRALGALPADPVPGVDSVASEEHIRDGDRLRDADRYAEAAQAYGRALALSPERSDIRIQYGNMLKDAGRLAQAEAAYRYALAQTPQDAEIHLQLGHALKLQGRRPEALLAYRRAIEREPSLEAAWSEWFKAAFPPSRQQAMEGQAACGDVEGLLAMTEEVLGAVARLTKALPDLYAQIAFPVASYDRFRSLFDVPAPPPAKADRSFGIVMTVAGMPLERVYAQLASVSVQTYCNWRLGVVGTDAAQRRVVERAAASDPRIGWIEAADDEAASVAERRTALALPADWIVLSATGALFHRHALGWFAAVVDQRVGHGAALAFITDEEQVSEDGGTPRRSAPQLRQAVDYDTLLEANPYGETVVVERAAYAAIAGGLVTASLSAARSSLLLNLACRGTVGHIPLPLIAGDAGSGAGGEGVDEGSLAGVIRAQSGQNRQSPPDPGCAHAAAVRAHLAGAGLGERVTVGWPIDATLPLAISWQPRDPYQTVQVIIPTRDNFRDIGDFVDTLRDRAAVPEAVQVLIIDNGSRHGETARVLAELRARNWVRVVVIDEPFNWSRLNNRAVALTEAALLVFANDDMLMLSDGWDRQLRGLLERPEIGAVGARLLYPDDSVQHAGMLFDWQGHALHDGRGEPVWRPGPCRRWHVSRTVGAVTGAFLAVRREVFEASGGFDEIGLGVGHSDVDFALKLRARGLKILWTPSITLRHYESKTRGLDHLDPEKQVRDAAERKVIQRRWGAAMEVDPGVNPHWHTAPRPFGLILAPPSARLWRHIKLCASADPWLPDPGIEQAAVPVSGHAAGGAKNPDQSRE
jgi:tetratricopeptide (TPR) repeat protein/GT2 family glycosyltransferase